MPNKAKTTHKKQLKINRQTKKRKKKTKNPSKKTQKQNKTKNRKKCKKWVCSATAYSKLFSTTKPGNLFEPSVEQAVDIRPNPAKSKGHCRFQH
jgi:hypothetical protein